MRPEAARDAADRGPRGVVAAAGLAAPQQTRGTLGGSVRGLVPVLVPVLTLVLTLVLGRRVGAGRGSRQVAGRSTIELRRAGRTQGEDADHGGAGRSPADDDQRAVPRTSRRRGGSRSGGRSASGEWAGEPRCTTVQPTRALETVGGAAVGAVCHGEPCEPGLDPAFSLDEVTTRVTVVDVRPRALLLVGGESSVEQRTDAGAEVHHDPALVGSGVVHRAGVALAPLDGRPVDQGPTKHRAAPVDAGADGAQLGVEDLGDLLVGQPLDVAQHHRRAEVGRHVARARSMSSSKRWSA